MNSSARLSLLLLAACATIASCAKQPSANLASASAATAASACETLVVKAADLGGLLHAPITHATDLAGDDQSCAFLTTGFSAITVSVRPGLGRASLDAWAAGKMSLAVTPLSGVGDAAVWQDTLHEIIARKSDLLCDIQLRGVSEDIAVAAESLPGALGALCNRIFVSHRVN